LLQDLLEVNGHEHFAQDLLNCAVSPAFAAVTLGQQGLLDELGLGKPSLGFGRAQLYFRLLEPIVELLQGVSDVVL
jgi:hypothetical protein